MNLHTLNDASQHKNIRWLGGATSVRKKNIPHVPANEKQLLGHLVGISQEVGELFLHDYALLVVAHLIERLYRLPVCIQIAELNRLHQSHASKEVRGPDSPFTGNAFDNLDIQCH